MTENRDPLLHPVLGEFARDVTVLGDGEELVHSWYAGRTPLGDREIELLVGSDDPDQATRLMGPLAEVVAALPQLLRTATDAVVTQFSEAEPDPMEFDEAAAILQLDAVEASAEGLVVLHFTDTTGSQFPEGYWPAVHLGEGLAVEKVTVEA